LVQPRTALKIPHPLPPLSAGLPNYIASVTGHTILVLRAYVNVPYTLVNIIGSRTRANFYSITSNSIVPSLCFKEPDTSGEETGSHKVKKASGSNEEVLEP
jgi:hypothetical protein